MNRRNFFSLAALSLGGLICGRQALRPTPTPTPTVLPAQKGSLFDLAPLDLGEMRQAHMLAQAECPSHSHSINDPGHRHCQVFENGDWHQIEDPGHSHQIPNPNWIPAEGQWVMIGDKPMHYVHYDLV